MLHIERLPVSEDIINRVHYFSIEEEQPLVATTFEFERRMDYGEIEGEEDEGRLCNYN